MTTLDRLRQPGPGRERQGRTPPLSRRLRVPIDLTNRPSIDRPSITDPDRAPPARRALAGLRHHLRRDLILRRPTSPQNESPSPWLKHPQRGPPRLPRRLDFDKRPESVYLDLAQMQVVDQDLSSVLGGHWPMVSYLWSVVSLAALKLPLRITTNRVYAISATQAIHRRAHGNERTQF